MDDYSINSLTESKNEWSARLVSILTTCINQGINSIFDEANKLCIENNEENKYLMTFQNLLSTIPNWNPSTIENEKKRIEQVSGCKYLEELITCVHIIQLKALTCIRVGQKQKKIDIDIPSLDKFIHQIYINVARKLYTNIYLYEKDIYPLQKQKNYRELEILIKEGILLTIRENIPVEDILRLYMSETQEEEVIEEKIELKQNSINNKISDLSNNNDCPETTNETTNDKLDDMAKKIKDDIKNKIKDETEIVNIKESSIEKSLDLHKELDSEILENKDIPNSKEVKSDIEDKNNISIDFSNIDNVIDSKDNNIEVTAPKDLETLETISAINNAKRAAEEAEDDDSDKLSIGDDFELSLDTIELSPEESLDIETL